MNIGNIEIGRIKIEGPKINIEPNKAFPSYESLILTKYEEIRNSHAQALEKIILEDKRVQAINGRMLNSGNGTYKFNGDYLTPWLLWRIHEVGQEAAQEELNRFLDNDKHKIHVVTWVYGIKPKNTYHFNNGVSLVPIDEMYDSNDKEFFLKAKFGCFSYLFPAPEAALIKTVLIEKIPNDQTKPIKSPEYEAKLEINKVILLINTIQDTHCAPAIETTSFPNNVPLGPFAGRGYGPENADIIPRKICTFKEKHHELLNQLLHPYDQLLKKQKYTIEEAIKRLGQVKWRANPWDKFLDLGIALEMLLLNTDNNISKPDQLSLTFRLRGAWLLGKDKTERKEIYSLLRTIYNLRSQIAHNGRSKDLAEMPYKEREQLTLTCINIAEKTIQKLIQEGFPRDWQDKLLGE